MIGLKRNTVQLEKHQKEWEIGAQKTINILHEILKDSVIDIQHVGSTSIHSIAAKPILDITVGMKKVEDILFYIPRLEEKGIFYRGSDVKNQYLFVIGDFEKDTRSHHIHVVEYNGKQWNDYINFRDYLNTFDEEAKKYEQLKIELAYQYANDRVAYTNGKINLINEMLEKVGKWRKEQ